MHATLERFGYPDSLLRAYPGWAVVLRPAQATVGSLVVAHTGSAERFSDLSTEAFAGFEAVVRDVEAALTKAFAYDKVNWLMLMMNDPHVHFHVIPRYAASVRVDDAALEDAGWPGPPSLATPLSLTEGQRGEIRERLLAAWPVA